MTNDRIKNYDAIIRQHYPAMGATMMADKGLCGAFTLGQISRRARDLGVCVDPIVSLERRRESAARALIAFKAKAEARRNAPKPQPIPKVRKARAPEPLLNTRRCPSIFALGALMGLA